MTDEIDGRRVQAAAGRIRAAMVESERRQVAVLAAVAARVRSHLDAEREPLLARARDALRIGVPPSLRALVGIRHLEVPMNKVLGWLMDPAEPHGLGVGPLRALASLVRFDDLVADLDRGGTIEVWVERSPNGSGRAPDLLVRTAGAALLVENKVHAEESGEGQYSEYLEILAEFAEHRARRAHLLSRDTRDQEPGWDAPLTHADLAAALLPLVRDPTSPAWSRAVVGLVRVDLLDVDLPRAMDDVRRLVGTGAAGAAGLLELSRRLDLIESNGAAEVFGG